ncbi:hypothetical protein CaCOL14_010888 [Colletotrichum acutatum]
MPEDTPESWGKSYYGGHNNAYPHGPPKTGTGTQGGHTDQKAVSATKGGRHGSGASGHHSSTTQDLSAYKFLTDRELEADLKADAFERQDYTHECEESRSQLQPKNAQSATGPPSGKRT